MTQTFGFSRLIVIIAVLFGTASALSQVNSSELVASLTAVVVVPTVDLGSTGSVANSVVVNGRPATFPVKTLIYPNGQERFRVESGILHADAVGYKVYNRGLQFLIGKIELKGDYLELKLQCVADTKQSAVVKLMLGPGWQSSMTTESALQTVLKYLPDGETVAKAAAESERVSAAEAEKARIAAEQAQAAAQAEAEKARLEQEKARAVAQLAEQQKPKSTNSDGNAKATAQGPKPKPGKPSYEETESWLASKFNKMGYAYTFGTSGYWRLSYTFKSMDGCALRFRTRIQSTHGEFGSCLGCTIQVENPDVISEETVTLADGTRAVDGSFRTDYSELDIINNHASTVQILHEKDYDTVQLAQRIATALNHAAKLCEPPPKKNTEPF